MATTRTGDRAAGGRLVNGGAGARALAAVCVAASAALVLSASPAEAGPSDQAKLDKLNSQADHYDNEYNKAKEQWEAAKAKLATLNKSVAHQKKVYEQLRQSVVQLAASEYKTGATGSIPALVSAKDPEAVLDQISLFTQLTHNRSALVTQFLNAAQLLQRQQAQAKQAADDLRAKKDSLLKKKQQIEKTIARQKKAMGDRAGSGSSGIGGTYNGPASGNARIVLKWAYSKLGTPYQYGGTGPRYDCSGFVMVAWRQAGVSLPRVVPDQYNATRRVAKSDLQPGDLVFFDSLGHVGIYVGGGKFIHSPHTGDVVKISSMNDSWYSSHYYGAGRP